MSRRRGGNTPFITSAWNGNETFSVSSPIRTPMRTTMPLKRDTGDIYNMARMTPIASGREAIHRARFRVSRSGEIPATAGPATSSRRGSASGQVVPRSCSTPVRQIRPIVDFDKPERSAIDARDQCVAFLGVDSSVATITPST